MTTITNGMTPDQFITALNANFVELAGIWDVDILSFEVLNSAMSGDQLLFNINHNFRALSISFGESGGSFISALNSSFATIVHRFQDYRVANVFNIESAEPTALVSDDGEQMDVWDGFGNYRSTTDGINFSANIAIDIPSGNNGHHMLKVGDTYYCYVMHWDGTMYSTIRLFTSTNKINFTDQGDVIGIGVNGGWNVVDVGNCFVWKEGVVWYMIYEAHYGVGGYGLGLATANAPEGPWTGDAGNPILPYPGSGEGFGNPEMPRVNNEVIKHNGCYYLYFHYDNAGPKRNLYRAYSADLHIWTIEGSILNSRIPPTAPGVSNGDPCLCQFKGKSYLFYMNNSNGGGVNIHDDMTVDNRPLSELLALYP